MVRWGHAGGGTRSIFDFTSVTGARCLARLVLPSVHTNADDVGGSVARCRAPLPAVMSAFKTKRDLLGLSDDDEEDEDIENGEPAADGEGSDDASSEPEDEADDGDGGDVEAKRARIREKDWLATHFIRQQKTSTGVVYKSELLPDKVFFSREKLGEFVKGKRYMRLLREMRKGMRTHSDNEKLKAKADARKARLHAKKEERRKEQRGKRKAKRVLDSTEAGNADEIERRQASFQAKKARRLARRAE